MLNSTGKKADRGIGLVLLGVGLAFIVTAAVFMFQQYNQLQSMNQMPWQQPAASTQPVTPPTTVPISDRIRAFTAWSALLFFALAILGIMAVFIHRWAQRIRRQTAARKPAHTDHQDAWSLSGKRFRQQ